MSWIPALSTTTLLALALWLSRNLISTRLTNSVRHEYDTKIESLKTELRQNEESFKADLRAKESQIEALRSGALSGISNRQSAIFQRQLEAIEQLWNVVVLLGPAKAISGTMAVIKFETAVKEAAKNPKAREMFAMVSDIDMKTLPTSQALKTRPFVSPLVWAYYSAYEAIVTHAVLLMHMLKNGIDMVEVIDSKHVTKLVKLALPHHVEYIEKYGPSAFHNLLEELESNLLAAFKLMFKGEELDKETVDKAANIIKQAEILMESNTTAAQKN